MTGSPVATHRTEHNSPQSEHDRWRFRSQQAGDTRKEGVNAGTRPVKDPSTGTNPAPHGS